MCTGSYVISKLENFYLCTLAIHISTPHLWDSYDANV